MKTLSKEQMETVCGGQTAFMIGMMCGATLLLALSGPFAALAGATGAGCLTGIAALRYWKSQGIDVDQME